MTRSPAANCVRASRRSVLLSALAACSALATLVVAPSAWAVRIDVGVNGQCTVTEAVVTAMNPAQNPQPGCTRTADGQARILVKIAAGQYSVPASLNVPSSLTVEGAGVTQTTINSPGRVFTVPGSAASPTLQIRNLMLKGQFVGEGVFVNGAPASAVLIGARVESFNIGVRIESPQNLVDGRSSGVVDNSTIADSRQGGVSIVNSDLGVASSFIAGNLGGGIRARLFSPNSRIDVSSSRVDNNGNTNAGGGVRVTCEGSVRTNATLNVLDSLVQFNQSSGNGGGLFTTCDTNVFRTTFQNNTSAAGGGGIAMQVPVNGQGIDLTVIASRIESNTADQGGGVMVDGGGTAQVEGIFQQTLIANNRSAHDGGGIYSLAQPTLTNCTVTLNTAGNPGQTARGGGIFHQGGELHLVHDTIANNAANTAGGGVMTTSSNFITSFNIVADNSAPTTASQSPDWVFLGIKPGTPIGSRNLIRNRNGITAEFPTAAPNNNIDNVSPNLGPLQNLGGFARVRPLLAGSAAMDRIPLNEDSVTVDQRGTTRPQNGPDGAGRGNLSDIGAFEATP